MTNLPTTGEELAELAQKGAVALVGAMATNAFRAARHRISRLFGRLGPEQEHTAATQLDADEDLLTDTDDAERDDVREELAPGWRRRLARLLRDDPDAAEELRDVVAALQAELPEERQQWVMTVIARDHSTVYAAQGGNIIHHDIHHDIHSNTPGHPAPDQPR